MSQPISNLPVLAKVKDTGTTYYGSPIIWQIADKNHAGYPANSVTLVAANILKVCCFDAIEASNSDSGRRSYGNNRYSVANLRQWLNKAGSPWYQAQHGADAAPTNANVWSNYNEYDAQPGFLTGFSADMIAALLSTTLTVAKATVDGGGSESVVDKVFLLSKQEVGLGTENGIAEGSLLAMFSADNSSRLCKPTANAVSNSEYTNSSFSASKNWYWWLRSPDSSYSRYVRLVGTDGSADSGRAYDGRFGVRPALNLSSGILVSDTPGSDGAYTIIWNQAPTTPPSITIPEDVRSGKPVVITWGGSTDPEGGAVSYELERKINSGSFTQVYAGSALTYTDTGVGASANTVQWRVRAKDNYGEYSAYLTGPARSVIHNVDPTVSGSDIDLGVVTEPPSTVYTVNDADTEDELTVYERIDGVDVRTIEDAVRNQPYTFAMTAEQFAALAHGTHTMTITVIDTIGNSVTRTITFRRSVTGIEFIVGPINTDAKADKVLVSLRFYANDNDVTLAVCNNANDASPTWEAANPGLKHIFSNTTKTAASWAIGVKVKIDKSVGYDTISCQPPSGSYV
ncbi:MAG: hypothetical protein BWY85_00234 [Firmicutes bacterium ADurb.Bin506]|nr:MAG: hypothetical protein BWY85_00234 [Firmicutes bacterium ADurb.Bin506]